MGRDADTDIQGTPAWFEFGRAVLIRHVSMMATKINGTAQTEPSTPPPDIELLDERLATTRAALIASLDEHNAFATLAANAHLSVEEAEVFAVAASAERDFGEYFSLVID